LPSGALKVLIDGGAQYSAVQAVQLNNGMATSLMIGFDTEPGGSAAFRPVTAAAGARLGSAVTHRRARTPRAWPATAGARSK